MDTIASLGPRECRELLGTATVGRLALTRDALPVILPVNYAVDGHSVILRTGDGTILRAARAGDTVAAFEVDHLDEATRTGWSVLVTGTLLEVTDVDALQRAEQLPLTPWADGDRPHYVRLTPGMISGRRVRAAGGSGEPPQRESGRARGPGTSAAPGWAANE